jgi:2-hydroxychromene-2-carboxylate isomerase
MQQRTLGTLEFWFDFGSNYSYLSVMRIGDLARSAGVDVQWRPFLLGPIFKSFGWETSPFVLQKEKGEYVWQDMVRECRKYGIPWQRPSVFPRHSLLPLRIAVHGADQPWMEQFCERVMLRNFAADHDINAESSMAVVLDGLGLDASAIIEAAGSTENKLRLRERTGQAKARGIFGAPTFFVGDDMFWGNDRLDDALALARQRFPCA